LSSKVISHILITYNK